jgi:hypothetical protein
MLLNLLLKVSHPSAYALSLTSFHSACHHPPPPLTRGTLKVTRGLAHYLTKRSSIMGPNKCNRLRRMLCQVPVYTLGAGRVPHLNSLTLT